MPNLPQPYNEYLTWLIPRFLACFVLATVVLIVTKRVCLKLRERIEEEDADPAVFRSELLSQFGELEQQGAVSAEEYRSIKSRLQASRPAAGDADSDDVDDQAD